MHKPGRRQPLKVDSKEKKRKITPETPHWKDGLTVLPPASLSFSLVDNSSDGPRALGTGGDDELLGRHLGPPFVAHPADPLLALLLVVGVGEALAQRFVLGPVAGGDPRPRDEARGDQQMFQAEASLPGRLGEIVLLHPGEAQLAHGGAELGVDLGADAVEDGKVRFVAIGALLASSSGYTILAVAAEVGTESKKEKKEKS